MRLMEPFKVITRSDILFLNSLAVIIGVLCGFTAIGFRYLISLIREIMMFGKFSAATDSTSPLLSPFGIFIILVPAAGGLLVGLLTHYFAPEVKGHGVPEVMAAVVTQGGRIRPRVAFIKSLASAITIGSGGSAGREGPIVQIGSASASALGQIFRLKGNTLRILVACGAAGGITATFNTPVAGVVFAIEIILLEFKTRSFIPLVVSSVIATVISRLFLGSSPAFTVPAYAFESPIELLFYLVLGILAGLVGILMCKSLYFSEDLFERLRAPEWIKPAIGGLLVGLLFFKFRHVMGVGYETMGEALNQNLPLYVMFALIFAKVLAVSLSLGSGGSGGVFAPSLFIGCMLGGAFGYAVHSLFPDVTATYGAYALVGMAALFSAVGRATLTAIIIIFEMTLDYNIILPLMFACVVADGVSFLFLKDNIYTEKLSRKGIHIYQDLASDYMSAITAGMIMNRNVKTVTYDVTPAQISKIMRETELHGFPILDRKKNLVSIVTEFDVEQARRKKTTRKPVKDLPLRELVVAYPDDTLDSVVGKMMSKKISHIPVIEREGPKKVLGIITRTDILRIRQREE